MSLSRRLFLKNGAITLASVGMAGFGPSFLRSTVLADTTAQKRKKTLICIFQRGAADGLNIVVPHGDRDLYTHRPGFAINRPSGSDPQAALDLDGFFGFHPALAPFMPIYKEGHLAAIQACGSPDGTRSHFDAQDYMEAGTPGSKRVPGGWLSRAVLACPEDRAKLSAFRAVAMGCDNGLPLSLQGDAGALAIPDLANFGIGLKNLKGKQSAQAVAQTGAVDGFESIYTSAVGDVLHGTGTESFEAIAALNKLSRRQLCPREQCEISQRPLWPITDADRPTRESRCRRRGRLRRNRWLGHPHPAARPADQQLQGLQPSHFRTVLRPRRPDERRRDPNHE